MAKERVNDGIIIVGPVGRRKDPKRELSDYQGYRASLRRIDISDEDLLMGDFTYDLFVDQFRRPQPWFIDFPSGVIVDTGINRRVVREAVAANPDIRFEAPATMRFLRLDALRAERLPEMLLQNIVSSWQVEMGLKDFSKAGQEDYGRSRGQGLAYHQWSAEEANHGELEEQIAKGVDGGFSEKDFDILRKGMLSAEWINPFTTRRRTTIYAALQEPMTAAVYTAVANQAETDAPTVSELLMVVAKDESFHAAWFREVTEFYAQLDREGTEQDVYFVARHFRMPGDYYFLDPVATVRAYRRGLGYSQQSFARRLHEFMNRFTFVDRNKTLLVTAEFGGTIGDIGKEELDEILHWPSEKLAEAFKTDDRLKAAKYKTETEVLSSRKSRLVI